MVKISLLLFYASYFMKFSNYKYYITMTEV